jgi:Ser/Thr protein kinase RdoA (MazF antagonist)
MSALGDLIRALPQRQREVAYDELAQVALRGFGVTAQEVKFLGHNSGVAYRVDASAAERLLLKVHAPQGDGESPTPAAILAGLEWLVRLAESIDTPVQTPRPDLTGAFLATVTVRGLRVHCSLQRWINGRHVDELTSNQAREVGILLGRWHSFSEMSGAMTSDDAMRYDRRHLDMALAELHELTTDGVLANEAWSTIVQATAIASRLAEGLGDSSEVFGVIHGDVTPDNILVADDGNIRFIDFAQLAVGPYLWDLGVTLYHYSYQDASVRRAVVEGYRISRSEAVIPPLALDAFVCVAALSNLAFQCTIPGQRESKLFRTNLNQFAAGYCTDLVDGRPFALE